MTDQINPLHQQMFDSAIDELRAQMAVLFRETSGKIPPNFAPSVALEFSKVGVATAGLALCQVFGLEPSDALIREIATDICTHMKICIKQPEGQPAPIGAYEFIERLRKRGMQ